jgi:hypothetical protein
MLHQLTLPQAVRHALVTLTTATLPMRGAEGVAKRGPQALIYTVAA